MTAGLILGLYSFTGGLGRLGALERELGLDTWTGGPVLVLEAWAAGFGLNSMAGGLGLDALMGGLGLLLLPLTGRLGLGLSE